ncbi:MAG: hypothetical protein SU899_02650 [Chloroflexota bacterium]|nr:hypothetical protein [Chloroflexota bacterium]
MKTTIIEPNPPYNIKPHWESYTFEQPQPHIYQDGIWRRALRLENKKLVPTEVELNKDIENPRLKVTLYTDLNETEERETVEKVKWIFNTEYDLKRLYEFMDSDPKFREVKNHHYGLKPAYISTVYEGIITAIIQQQISLRIAGHMARLLIQKFGERIEANSEEFWEFPSSQKLSQAKVEDLRSCGLSGRKAEYIIAFSEAVARNGFDPELLKYREHGAIIEKITQFRGMGRWTAEMVIVTSINVGNMSPAGDLGARKTISHFYNQDKLMSEEEVRGFIKKWGEYKGIITYYLIAEYLYGR